MSRINHVNVLVAARGEGKTTYIIEKILPSTSQETVIIVDTFDHPAYNDIATDITINDIHKLEKGVFHLWGSDTEAIMDALNKRASNALIIYEDATKYIKKVLTKDVEKLVLDTKQKNIDMILMFHKFSKVPSDLFSYADSVTFFRTKEVIENQKSRLDFYDDLIGPYLKLKANKAQYVKPVTILL